MITHFDIEAPILAVGDPNETGFPIMLVDSPDKLDVPLVGLVFSNGYEYPILAFAFDVTGR